MAASAFSLAFSPWENPGTEPGARLSNLKVIFNKAADLGILMFSQPSVFRFDWKPGEVKMKPNKIVVSPELLKVADENAMTLLRAQKMIKIKFSALRMVMEIDGAGEYIPAELQGKHDQKGFRAQKTKRAWKGGHKPHKPHRIEQFQKQSPTKLRPVAMG